MEIYEKYWLAAIIDCEGSLLINRKYYVHHLEISNTNLELLAKVQQLIGRRIYHNSDKPHLHRKPVYKLILARKDDIRRVLSEAKEMLKELGFINEMECGVI